MRLPKFFSVCELKLKYLSHKTALWIDEPELKFRKKTIREDSKAQKSRSTKRCKLAWEWGTNEYICLPYVTILWYWSWKLPKDRGKMKLILLASKELSRLWNLGSPFFLNLDYNQWLKWINIAFGNSDNLKKSSKVVPSE